MRYLKFGFWLLIVALWLPAAGASEPLLIYSVNYPLQYFAQRIAGEHAEVVCPAPAGTDPAFWNPDAETVAATDAACRKAEIGCVECKKKMAEFLLEGLAPIHDKRAYYLEHPDLVDEIFANGCEQAARVARATMEEVRASISF